MSYRDSDFSTVEKRSGDDSVAIYLKNIDRWNDYDLILDLLKKESDCVLVSTEEHIYQRRAELTWEGYPFELRHDCVMGNFFFSDRVEEASVVELLSHVVVESIKNKLDEIGLLEHTKTKKK
ncbi:MAG: hypothetical protein FWG24_01390 [Eggerthellaceae bacterium]|jgi:hypothetical protein|nr:hypothetical protein [Eggerthellaceae bacterium]